MLNTGNLIADAKTQVAQLTQTAYETASTKGLLPPDVSVQGVVEIPKDVSHGDFASSYAMVGAKAMKQKPRDIAQILVDHMNLDDSYFQSVTIAGAGFLNFSLSPKWYGAVLDVVQDLGTAYGKAPQKNGKKVMVEFVSANPTGPMHMGNARGGVLGDTLANVLDYAGWDAWKEFYINDAGNQIHKFSCSIDARYRQLIHGDDAVPFSPDFYQGDDIKALAQNILDTHGTAWDSLPEEDRLRNMAEYGLSINIPKMKANLSQYGISYDLWFSESSLYESGAVEATLARLTEKGYTYENEGALWLDTTKLLKEKFMSEGKTQEQVDKLDLKDDVLRRANGFYTYFAADIAYHADKLETRGFDLAINIWGADHHGHVARIQAAMDALGLDGSHRLVVVLMQLVKLLQDGKAVKMAKRTGKAIALEDLLDDISVDAARFFFNNRVSTSSLEFDLDLAVRQDSENPVYYVQYAHARICSLVARVQKEGTPNPTVDASVLTSKDELALLKSLAQFPEEIQLAARDFDPSRINRYLIALAGDFHRFYNNNHILGEANEVLTARLALASCTGAVLNQGLTLLGVTAPQRMNKLEDEGQD